MYGGGTFGDYGTFPGKKPHSPSGRYQITQDAYERLSQKLGLTDFSPSTQDRMAVQLIVERKALEPLLAGRLDDVIPRLTGIWSSLPHGADETGGSYRPFRLYAQVRDAFDLNLLKYRHP